LNFLLLLLLPILFWDKGPETAGQLRQAQIEHIAVPPSRANDWKGTAGISIDVEDTTKLTTIQPPSVTFRSRVASATRAPWVNSNGWRFLREPNGHFYYEAPGEIAALAAAEAFTYGVRATIHTDDAGLPVLGKILQFLQREGGPALPPLVNIGFLDDGSAESGEFMNLLVRRNLLFKVVKQREAKLDLTAGLGMPDYPKAEAANPSLLAEKVRSHLTDDKRLLRIYGSEVVVGRLVGQGEQARVYLINYGAARGPVQGVRIRVLGVYPKQKAAQPDSTETNLMDVTAEAGATEFTLPGLKSFAIINLAH
jgi:hypothetical protein